MKLQQIVAGYLEEKNREKAIAEAEETLKQVNETKPDYQRIADDTIQEIQEKFPHCRFKDDSLYLGDEVLILSHTNSRIEGLTGKIVNLGGIMSGVEFDNPVPDGKSCDGMAKMGYGRYIDNVCFAKKSRFAEMRDFNRFLDTAANELMRESEIKEGDKVEVAVEYYSQAAKGSWGYVKNIDGNLLGIDFHRISGKDLNSPAWFNGINKNHVSLVENREDVKRLLQGAREKAEQESGEYEKRKAEIIRKSREKLRAAGLSKEEISEFLAKNLNTCQE